uniref:Uncharacterized protein n=1 Tax=Arundo donax TaxID=35708 RepID=A0A0A8Z7P6_ARUDO
MVQKNYAEIGGNYNTLMPSILVEE